MDIYSVTEHTDFAIRFEVTHANVILLTPVRNYGLACPHLLETEATQHIVMDVFCTESYPSQTKTVENRQNCIYALK